MPSRPLRLPLATGASSLRSIALPSGVLQLLAFGPLFIATKLPGWTVYPIAALWAVWFFTVIGTVLDGWRRRASDVVLDADGLALRGGPHHGTRLRWEDVDPERCRVDEVVGEEGVPAGSALVLQGVPLAESADPAEIRSFHALADTVRAVARGRTEAAPAKREPREAVLACTACGAPQAPRDEPSVRCRHCGADVPIPAEVRASLADLARLDDARREGERLLASLVRQPGARVTSALFALGVPPIVLAWPLATIVYDELFQTRHVAGFAHGAALFVAGLAASYGLAVLLQAQLVGRAALRLVALRFAARPPACPGDPDECRRCGAPLPDAPDQAVVRCAYCRAENLTGLDLAGTAGVEGEQTAGLADTLRERLAARRRLRLLAALAAFALAAGAFGLWRTFRGPCVDGVRDGDETDVDCGGVCVRCLAGQACRDGGDCRSGICRADACAAPACDDGVYNGDESSTDCGGSCQPCADGMNCRGPHDCVSGACTMSGECAAR